MKRAFGLFSPVLVVFMLVIFMVSCSKDSGPNEPQEDPTQTPAFSPTVTATQTPAPTTVVFQNGADSYAGCEDTYLSGTDPYYNFGQYSWIYIASYDGRQRTLIKFDVSSLSPGISIQSAAITFVKSAGAGDDIDIRAFKVTTPWDEGAESDAYGAPNWVSVSASTAWGSPGGDTEASPFVTGVQVFQADPEFSLPLPVSLVEDWINNPSQNYGILIDYGSSGTLWTTGQSSEWGTVSERPKLEIKYY